MVIMSDVYDKAGSIPLWDELMDKCEYRFSLPSISWFHFCLSYLKGASRIINQELQYSSMWHKLLPEPVDLFKDYIVNSRFCLNHLIVA